MDNHRLGLTILILSSLVGIVSFMGMSRFSNHAQELGCIPNQQCSAVESVLNWSHFTFGIVFAVFALGIYLLFFSKSEYLLREAMKRLEAEKDRLQREHTVKISDEKFAAVLNILAPSEQKVLKIIKEQEGITQNTLRIKAGLSKAKVSQVVSDFSKRGLIKREEKGKTFSLHLSHL